MFVTIKNESYGLILLKKEFEKKSKFEFQTQKGTDVYLRRKWFPN